ncbi:hypothetical protein FOZ62_023630, partial [Perkinsus olseni]
GEPLNMGFVVPSAINHSAEYTGSTILNSSVHSILDFARYELCGPSILLEIGYRMVGIRLSDPSIVDEAFIMKLLVLTGVTVDHPEAGSEGSGVELHHIHLVHLANQLKYGRGLFIVGAIVESPQMAHGGSPHGKDCTPLPNWNAAVQQGLNEIGIPGFAQILHCSPGSRSIALQCLLQTSGLGAFEPNAVMASWPLLWLVDTETRYTFMNFMLNCEVLKKTVILAKNFEDLQLYDKQPSGTTMDVWWNIGDGGWGIMLAYLFRKHPVWRDCRIRVFHIVDSLTEQEAEADLGAVSSTIQEWLKHHRLDDFISEVQVINVEFEGGEWANQASVKVSHAGETLRRTLALSDFTNKSSMSLGVGDFTKFSHRRPRGRLVMEDIEFDDISSEPPRLGRVPSLGDQLEKWYPPTFASLEAIFTGSKVTPCKTVRGECVRIGCGEARKYEDESSPVSLPQVVNEQMVLHSSDAGVVITNLFDVPEGEGSLAYMQLVELFCADLKRVLLIRGNVVDEVIPTS